MKYHNSIFLLLIAPIFLSGIIKQKSNPKFDKAVATFTKVNDDLRSSNVTAYKVKFTYTGYVSFLGECPEAGQNGTVVLEGKLTGTEDTSSDDDILYRGILHLEIRIDICSAKRKANGEDVRCIITVDGSGLVKTELEIQYDQRGGYIQIKDTVPGFKRNVTGTCDPQEMLEEQTMVPLKSIASIFNGTELPMLTQRTLRAVKYPQKYPPIGVDGGKIVVEVLEAVKP